MKFVYRTRGNTTPQGKPRVYFTGHPADLPACSEDIITDILNMQNCAVYYDEEPDAPWDEKELMRELEQMQLIVIPVTSRFLEQPGRARDVEFPFALERHIPVLPLMQEQGLEEDFNEKCGDLQVLNKYNPDSTALPYAKKLEKFLASVLVGDELAEKVRAAFDAYVFLSYRKKDRRYAQELMRLIHKNELCRDIAIWYDEFLVPGENFNQAIADAMSRCSLFTLAVTPNIVEADNYVMCLEYPEAKKAGKPIFPVELVSTDREELEHSFPDLPPCTDAGDERAFSDALLREVQKLALDENENDPEHSFFIGLAYLNGIDVEVDRERALGLITSAAKAGVPEAMQKLVDMLRSGDGVARDYHASIQWQERLTDYWRARYEESGAKDDGESLVMALSDLGDYQYVLVNLAEAKQVYQQMMALIRQLLNLYGDEWMQDHLASGFERLGDISIEEGKLWEAKDYYQQILELYRKLWEETKTVRAAWGLSIGYSKRGSISEAEGKLSEAKGYYQQSLGLRRQVWEETETAEAARDLALTYNNLGNISRAEGNLAEAEAYFQQSLKLRRQLWEETKNVDAQQDLSLGYNRLGTISRAKGDLAEAKEYYLQALELNQKLCEETGTIRAQRNIAASCHRLGTISEEQGDLAEAKKYYLQVLELSRQLYEETNTLEARRDLAYSCYNLGKISQGEEDLSQAEAYYLQCLKLRRQLWEETGSIEAQTDLGVVYNRLGDISRATGKPAKAKEYYLQSLELSRKLWEETEGVKAQWNLALSYGRMGDISRDEGNLDEAETYYRKALEVNRKLYEKSVDVQIENNLISSCEKLGGLMRAKGNFAGAREYYLQCLELSRGLWEKTGTVKARNNLAGSCYNVGTVSEAETKKSMFAQAFGIWSELCEKCPDVPVYVQWRDMAREALDELN